MKLKLSTFFWLFSVVCLVVLLLITNSRYQSIYRAHNARKQLIEAEYLSVTGDPISQRRLEEAMVETDRLSVGVAQTFAQRDIHRKKIGSLKEPSVLLQLRSGAVGGNPVSIDMVGGNRFIRDLSAEEFDFDPEVDSNEKPKGFFRGGFIPEDKVFVIRKVAFKGVAHGDSNGSGEFGVDILNNKIVEIENSSDVSNRVWLGKFIVRPGEESLVSMRVSNSSAGEALITGDFEPIEDYPVK